MGWIAMVWEKTKREHELKKWLNLKSTQKLMTAHIKAKNENKILPKEYYTHFYLEYLEAWILFGVKEKILCEIFNHARKTLVEHYKQDEKRLNELEKQMNTKWQLTLNDGY